MKSENTVVYLKNNHVSVTIVKMAVFCGSPYSPYHT